MSIRNQLNDYLNDDPLPPVKSRRKQHPAGWEPGVVWNGDAGHIITPPVDADDETPRHRQLLESAGFDPDIYEIDGPLQWREWDANVGGGDIRRLRYWRANIRLKLSDRPDVGELVARIRRHKPAKPAARQDGTLVVPLADWQLGKSDGDGTDGTVRRVLAAFDAADRELRRLKPARLLIAGMGDLVEGCHSFYGNQPWLVDLNRRDQERLTRELLTAGIVRLSKRVDQMTVVTVGGNHGENRNNGAKATDDADNADVAVFEQVAAVLAANPDAFGHVSFVIPNDELTVVLDVEGFNVAFTHGHLFGTGPSSRQKGVNWWKNQMYGRQPAGDAELLVSAHFHTFSVTQEGPRTHVACPTLDGGSKWFSDRHGVASRAGQLTFHMSDGGWDHLRVH